MTQKPKSPPRKFNFYRLMIYLCISGVGIVVTFWLMSLFQTEEYVYFYENNAVWRVSARPNSTATQVFYLEDASLSQKNLFDFDGKSVIYINNNEIHQHHLNTGEDSVLFTCPEIADFSRCDEFTFNSNRTQIVYRITFVSFDVEGYAIDRFQLRLHDFATGTDMILIDEYGWLSLVEWTSENTIELIVNPDTNASGYYDVLTNQLMINEDYTFESVSPNSEFVMTREYTEVATRVFRWRYYIQGAEDDERLYGYFETEVSNPSLVTWRPDSTGIIFHLRISEFGMPFNQIEYYKLEDQNSQVIFNLDQDIHQTRFDPQGLRSISWSPTGRYVLINLSSGGFVYDMRTELSHQLPIAPYPFTRSLGWEL